MSVSLQRPLTSKRFYPRHLSALYVPLSTNFFHSATRSELSTTWITFPTVMTKWTVPWPRAWTESNSWEVLWDPSFVSAYRELVRGGGGGKSPITCNFTPPSINYDRLVHAIILACPSWKLCMRLFVLKSRPWTMCLPKTVCILPFKRMGLCTPFARSTLKGANFCAVRRTSMNCLTLAGKLNSNEQFDPQRGFQLDVVVIRMPCPGRGNGKRLNVGRRSIARDNALKDVSSPLTIRTSYAVPDPLSPCVPGVTKTTLVSWEPTIGMSSDAGFRDKPSKRGNSINPRASLRVLAAWNSWRRFRVLSPQYQLKVMCRSKPFFILFRGPDAPHQIQLIKSDDHYEGCTSFSAFVNKSYWCHHCDRGFNDRALGKHACEGRTCRACARDMRHPCPDYDKHRTPDTNCAECNRRFYGPRCFQYHRDAGQ